MARLRARTALVTGANRGIGLAIAEALARQHGMTVLLGSRRLEDGRTAAARTGHRRVVAVALDLSESSVFADQYDAIMAAHGDVDVLVNNAGVYTPGGVLDVTSVDVRPSLQVHVLGPYELMRRALPGMIRRGYGHVVNVSAEGGLFSEGLDGPVAYAVSKAGLNALTLSAAKGLPSNVKVNGMCPGWVRTRMGGDTAPLSVEDGADTAVWLATLPDDGPTGWFFRSRQTVPW